MKLNKNAAGDIAADVNAAEGGIVTAAGENVTAGENIAADDIAQNPPLEGDAVATPQKSRLKKLKKPRITNNFPREDKIPPRDGTKVKKRRGRGVRWKIFGLLAVFTVIILVILWLCQTVFLADIYRAIKIGEIKYSAKALTEKIDSTDELVSSAFTLCDRGDMCIIVLEILNSDTVRVIVSEDTLPNCTIHNIDSQSRFTIYDRTVEAGGENIQSFRFDEVRRVYYSVDYNFIGSDAAGIDSIVYTLITRNSEGKDILLMLNSVVTPVAATVTTLRYMLIVISLVLLAIAMVFSIIFARSISRPIISLSESAKKLAAGDYSAQFDARGYREIQELSDTLTYAEQELSKVDSLRRELIANISHDLRTPLTMIEGYAEVMRDLPGENTPENTQIIIDEAKRLTTLVNDMLDISKWESGNAQLNMSQVNITRAVDELLTRYNRLRVDGGVVIRFDYDEPLEIYTDESKFIQALYNLVNNAITYTGADRTVYVRQTLEGECVKFTVTDSGEGIAPDKLEFIWERYYKADKVHRRASVGTGLGLSIVRSIITALGGAYGVNSTLGRGSTFWFTVPIKPPQNDILPEK